MSSMEPNSTMPFFDGKIGPKASRPSQVELAHVQQS
eukprot:CAMPEP_0169143496 /NCGR_PEP_ID=MMETSP1015-20121227/45629_1 /TAXON_ID=342587 /ORGANISM="Karlodinium micrum, Strain CCMP2283" /LENGTH=35 /DNA_ID= /DNA_START= /DNA_END= /DNA_ORIENTATION=